MITRPNERALKLVAAAGLALGGLLGLAGSFAPSDGLRGLAWGIDGISLVIASALLAAHYFRQGYDFVAAGYIVFAVGEGLVVSGSAMSLAAAAPSFGAGAGLWAAALVLISSPRVYPVWVRALGLVAAGMFAATALQTFLGTPLDAKSRPLPFFAYPVFVATMIGWILTLLRTSPPADR